MRLNPQQIEALVARVEQRDAAALATLYDLYGPMVYRVGYRFLNSQDDAEDLLQDVFVGLSDAVRSYRGSGTFEAWLRRIAVRTALMKLRRERRGSFLDRLADWGTRDSRPEDRISLESAIQKLPKTLRIVFLMKDVEGYTHKEIAELLGIAVIASKMRLHRARHQLRACLRDVAPE